MDESKSSAVSVGGERCVESESSTEARASGALTLTMAEASFKRMRNRPLFPPPTYDQWYAEQVMRAVKRGMGL